ncbi:hypothetical protein FZ025_06880 [Xanthomonas hyacinthi]|uniref:hypothetical protein n=1 Tax=Xanthomonas hyacinthi TaxID=56455 RepID=UPI000659829F|nr:hypothetical protein [Xanthomonas hyacinthi]KLD76054.1 hypothetical protein Y886_23460 [Xanthomonas hyacinthi DSM 19077]QGY76409.1 hypothetical protein FZ025_06880 [Xanthomonas hyacinthi]
MSDGSRCCVALPSHSGDRLGPVSTIVQDDRSERLSLLQLEPSPGTAYDVPIRRAHRCASQAKIMSGMRTFIDLQCPYCSSALK